MSPRMVPPGYSTLFPWLSEQDQASQAKYFAEFQDLYSRGMDRALGIQETTLECAVELQSTALDLYKAAPWYTPLFGEFFEAGTRLLMFCVELQMKCLEMMLPEKSAAAPISAARAAGSTSRAEQALQELAMDIGSGLATKKSMSAKRSPASC